MNFDGNLAALGRHERDQERAERRWRAGLALARESECPDCGGQAWSEELDDRLVCIARVRDGEATVLCGYVLTARAIGKLADEDSEGRREQAAEERAELARDDAERDRE